MAGRREPPSRRQLSKIKMLPAHTIPGDAALRAALFTSPYAFPDVADRVYPERQPVARDFEELDLVPTDPVGKETTSMW